MERKLLVKVVLVSAASVLLTLLVVVGVAWAADIFTVDKDGTVRLVVTDTGNVGIGTTTPSAKLHVNDGTLRTTRGSYRTDLYNTDTGAPRNEIYFADSAGTSFSIRNMDNMFDVVNFEGGTGLTLAGPTGNVGIGTADPKTKLHVTGLPEYADNAAALAAGLTAGAFYRTGEFLKVVY